MGKPVSEHAEQVAAMIRSWRQQGHSIRRMAELLDKRGFVTPKGFPMTASGVNNFIVKMRLQEMPRLLDVIEDTPVAAEAETTDFKASVQEIVDSNLRAETKLRFIQKLM